MSADAAGGLVVVVLFVAVLAVPTLSAYRGRYRSWTYRGLGTRYGAFAVGWIAVGLLAVVLGGLIRQRADAVGLAIGATGLLAMAAGVVFFAWMPPVLVPSWRRETLRNAKLYRNGDPAARLHANVLTMTDGRDIVVWRRNAPIIDSEWHALSVSAMHARPRFRLPGRLRGPLPDRATGVVREGPAAVEGELLVDGDDAVFVQSPAEDAAHGDNWFAVLGVPSAATLAGDGHGGTVMTLGTVPGHGTLELFLPGDPEGVRRELAGAMRSRRFRHTVEGRFSRVERTPTP